MVSVGSKSFPFSVQSFDELRVELELSGENVVIEGRTSGLGKPRSEVTINGEIHSVELVSRSEGSMAAPAPVAAHGVPTVTASARSQAEAGIVLTPPMPGRVLEVRVREGDRVRKGDVLLVLEAMKMRNELVAPVAGTVAELRVSAGMSARAGTALLRIIPDA